MVRLIGSSGQLEISDIQWFMLQGLVYATTGYNLDGEVEIQPEDATDIGVVLKEKLEAGVIRRLIKFASEVMRYKCEDCRGSGIKFIPDSYPQQCDKCQGTGLVKVNMVVDEESVLRFADFCLSSGGFIVVQ
jgi:DnaJ-class molecular chaperone